MIALARPDDVRDQNRRSVVQSVRKKGVLSRTEISKATGLSAATVSAITADLIEEQVLIAPTSDLDSTATGRGRPKVSLTINPEAAMVCAVYFQLDLITAAMVDYSGAIICEHTKPIQSGDLTSEQIRSSLIECIEGAKEKSGSAVGSLRRISVGFQGVTDVDGTKVLWTPICGQRDIPIQQWLEEHFGVPALVANDCDMIAQALTWQQPEKYGENFAAVLLAHGVGMGLFLRGNIINGTRSSGSEFGHMTYVPNGALCRCGNRGCVEAYAGDYAISRKARGEDETTSPSSMLNPPDLKKILQQAKDGDPQTLEAIKIAGAAIGTGLASLYALVDAFPVVLVGRGASLIDYMRPSILAALETAPGRMQHQKLELESHVDEKPLVREGCAISALILQDELLARRRPSREAAE